MQSGIMRAATGAGTRDRVVIGNIEGFTQLEREIGRGLPAAWEALARESSGSTFYQTPQWCLRWYRHYQDQFQPLLVTATVGERLAGVAPLAIERGTGRLTFAGDVMCDYRDVLVEPSSAAALVAAVLDRYRSEHPATVFWWGPMQPDSVTPHHVHAHTGWRSGTWSRTRSHPCWRLWFARSDMPEAALKKKTVRQSLKHYMKSGPVVLERISRPDEWDALKDDFFEQHGRRQAQLGRPVVFSDERKRNLYGSLLRRHPDQVHMTVLRVGSRALAYHYGYVWNGVLYWGVPCFDPVEDKYSPGLVLLALALRQARDDGLRGVDLTMGTEPYKARFGSECVALPSVYVDHDPIRHYAWCGREWAARRAPGSLARLRG